MKKRHLYISGLILVSGTMISNVINFVFNIYLGRTLTLQDFGELSLFTSLLYLTSVPLGSFSATTAHSIAILFGKRSKEHAQGYFRYMFGKTMIYGIVLTLAWAVCTPLLSHFFKTQSYTLMALFAPLWTLSVAGSNFSGYLKGTLAFGKLAILAVAESASRLIAVFLLISLGWHEYIVAAIVLSYVIQVMLGWIFCHDTNAIELEVEEKHFNGLFFWTSALIGISVITFLTLDVILVKHFLSATQAGEYGLLSLVGKMTYFFGSLFGPFMIPLVSHNEGAKKDSKRTFLFLFTITLFFSLVSFIGLGLMGWFVVPLIFGPKVVSILPLLPAYVLAMALFTSTQPIVSYFQAKENYSFAVIGFLISVLQIVLTILFHANLAQIVWVMLATSIANLIFMGVLYLIGDKLQSVYVVIKNIRRRIAYES